MNWNAKLAAATVAVGAFAVAGVAFAAIPGANGVISACYDKQSGMARIYDAAGGTPKGCGKSETAISWNQQGPKGDTGSQGEPGLSGYEVVEGDPFTTTGGTVGVISFCPAEKKPIGGGFTSTNADVNLYGSYPSPTENGWRIDVDFGVAQMTVTPYAVCATVTD